MFDHDLEQEKLYHPENFERDSDVPFVAFGNGELEQKPNIGKTIKCKNCSKRHKIKYGEKVLLDGTKEPYYHAGFVECGKKVFLVSLGGKKI